ncbi:thiol-disulfide oxidoreductase DCC family protein [Kistimonas asteriae]|uniref:thiol-disulfide oxidoreductase DCC family protein n=1 Tax=Kistimonas asteriae TaxID=517724 RepID=UPI001BA74E37|nr:DCC1-like thiol-disulfide oxidoreductase family protein [Kistimonas asteriae]
MEDHQIIIFDGICNFCNGAVNFIIERDSKGVFKFSPMQSEIAQELISKHQINEAGYDTFLLIKNEQCFVRTNAALEITKDLDGLWFMFRVLKIIPSVIRDFFYRLFARNRYNLFGKRSACMVPSKEVRDRFLT